MPRLSTQIGGLLTSLADCLCATLKQEGLPDLCFCGVLPGSTIPTDLAGFDSCDNAGMGWTRLVTSYPAAGVGVAARDISKCVGIGFDVEVGVMRAVTVEDDIPTSKETGEETQLQIEDMVAARKAIECCDGYSNKDYILGQYQPAGPLGGLVGGSWTVYFLL